MALSVDILTLFPRMISSYTEESILGKAREKGLLLVTAVDIRDFAAGKHHVCDDTPYGGGAGMVMKVEPLALAIEASKKRLPSAKVLLMSPRGQPLKQTKVREFAQASEMILVCGRYEGVDERVMAFVDEEVSLGDFILTGGELAALALVDAVSRLIPGVLGNEVSAQTETFEEGLLEHPHYTRPPEFRGQSVPEVLLSGAHARIARWRRWHSLRLTQAHRPDLFAELRLSKDDLKLLQFKEEEL